MDDPAGLNAQLQPLAAALTEAAHRDANAAIAQAEARAQSIQTEAETHAKEIVSKAEDEGAAAASRESARRLVAAKRQARRLVLEAQRASYDSLFDSALESVGATRDESAYASLEEKLAETAKATLGADAEVQHDPEGQGGVLARLGGRSVDLTLPVLVRRCIAQMGKDIATLWD